MLPVLGGRYDARVNPTPTFALRQATVADLETVLHHRRQMFQDMGQTDPAALDRMVETTRPLLRDWLAGGAYRGWLAVAEEGSVAGGGGVLVSPWLSNPWTCDPRLAMILNVYVEPEHRRRGIAGALMERMVEWCRAQGFRSVSLHASDEGRPLYEKLGFKPTNEMRFDLG